MVSFVEPPLGFEPMTFSLQGKGNIDLNAYREYLHKKFTRQYACLQFGYLRKYSSCYINPQGLSVIPASIRGNVLKAMVNLAKYLGRYEEYKVKLKNCGIKWQRADSLGAFLRIFNASNNDIIKWYKEARIKLRENEALFTKFLLHSGLRTGEAIHAFNLIIKLSKEDKLSEYYDSELQVLCHFKYPKLFIKRTKNCYITFITPEFVQQIAESKPITYSMSLARFFHSCFCQILEMKGPIACFSREIHNNSLDIF
jgi:hypothetical protein